MSEKTEQPTPKRIRDARKDGNIAKSQDVTSTVTLIGIFCYIGMGWNGHLKNLAEILLIPTEYIGERNLAIFKDQILWGVLLKAGAIIFPAVFTVALMGFIANFAQVGILLTTKPIMPKLDKLNPMGKLKQMFSLKNLVELLKSTFKIILLGILLYLLIKSIFDDLLSLPFIGVQGVLNLLGPVMKDFAKIVVFAYIIVAALDYVYQKRNWTKQLMMSKDEIKREYKESEGDGQIKSKRKQLHQEMLEEDPPQRTKSSSALVTNPEHMAIALLYDFENQIYPLPVVIAKGKGKMAERMIEVAKENNIPIIQNVPLAHALMDTANVMEYIPRELLVPVAEVLRFVRAKKAEEKALSCNY